MSGSVEESPDLREAWMLLFQGMVKPAADRFQAQLNATDDPGAAAGLLLCAAVSGAEAAVTALLADRWERRRDAALVLWRAAWICAANGSDQGLVRLRAVLIGIPPGAREHAAIDYAMGHLAMMRGDEPAAVELFRAARRGFDADPEWFLSPQDQTLSNVFVQTRHMLEEGKVAALIHDIEEPPEFGKTAKNQPLIAVAADGSYLRRFGRNFVQSLDRTNPGADLLVLALDAAPEDISDLAEAGPSLSVSFQHESPGFPGVNRSAVYASGRFLAMAGLLAAFKRPILVLDIDLTLRARLSPLVAAMKEGDFGCWFRPDGGPGGIVRGGATAFNPTSDAWWMACLSAGYIQARFEEERENLWFVDQAALWRASLEARKSRPGFRQIDFSGTGDFLDFFDLVRDEDVKRR